MEKPFEAIFFDADDTLFSVTPSVTFHYQEILREFGFLVEDALVETALSKTWEELKPFYENQSSNYRIFPHRDREMWREFSRRVSDTVIQEAYPPELLDGLYNRFAEGSSRILGEGIQEALECLSKQGYFLGIFTNNDLRVNKVLEAHGIAKYFKTVLTAECIGIKKPSPDVFTHIAERIGVAPSRILYIGDSATHDYEPARVAGWGSLLYDPKKKYSEHISIQSFSELLLEDFKTKAFHATKLEQA